MRHFRRPFVAAIAAAILAGAPQGAEAAKKGNVYGASRMDVPIQGPIDAWMVGPFHQLGIIDPLLEETGYGDYSEDVGRRVRFAATLNVLSRPGPGIAAPYLIPSCILRMAP